MLNIDRNGNITVNRGDTFNVPLFIDVCVDLIPFNSTRFPYKEEDKVYLRITEPNMPWEKPLLEKILSIEDLNENGDLIISFVNEDTNWIAPGTYYMEVKLQRPYEEGSIDALVTIVPRRKFIII